MLERWPRTFRALGLALVLVALGNQTGLNLAGPPTVSAATITVNTLEDSFLGNGNCSLREAISSANLNVAFDACTSGAAGADVINIAVAGTITLALAGKNEENNATGDLDILEGLTINGQGAVLGSSPASGTTINGNAVDRVFDVKPGAILVLNNLQVREGNPSSGGSNGGGGNIFSNGGLELNNVVIASGFAGNGGGVFAAGGTPFSATGTLVISNTAQGQAAPNNGGAGGGLFLDFNTVTTMNRVSFIQNTATSVSLIAARGGAVYNNGAADPVTNVQFDGNTTTAAQDSAHGAAILNDRIMRLTHATITNNTVSGSGTPAGGGVFNDGPTFEVTNSIVALNTPDNCALPVTNFFGFNLENGTSCGFVGVGQVNANPQIGALVTGSSQVQVRELNAGSPAIDTAETARCVAVDARNVGRPIDGDGNGSVLCDIGAFEAAFSAPTPTPTLTPTPTSTAGPGATGTPTPTPTPTPPPVVKQSDDDDDVRVRPPSEEEQRQKDRTNKGNHDDDFVEGNVVEVNPDADIPYVVIANRDGLVKVLLIHDAAYSARSIKVGDYLEADGVKQHEFLFEAENVKISKR